MRQVHLDGWLSFLALLLLVLLHGNALGYSGEGRTGASNGYLDITSQAYGLRDPEGSMTLDEVRHLDQAGRFAPMPANLGTPLWGHHPEVRWIRFTLKSPGQEPEDVIFSIWPLYLKEAVLYAPDAGGDFAIIDRQGMAVPVAQREFVDHAPAFLVTPSPTGTTYYLRLTTNQPLLLALRTWKPTQYQRMASLDTLLMGLAMGAILLMAVLNVVAWRILRERGQAYHAIYFVSFALAIFTLYGYTSLWLSPAEPWWNWRIETIPLTLLPLASTLFVSYLFDFPRNLPWLGHLFRGIALLQAGFLAATVAGEFDTIATMGILVSLASILVGAGGVLYLIFVRKRFEYTMQMIALSFGATSGLFILVVRMFGIVSLTPETATYIYQFSGVIHVLFLNGVLALRVRRSELRYRTARQARLAAALEAEHTLERHVQARTEELSRTNADLADEIARRIQVEHKLARTLNSERQAREQQRTFVSIVSHEFRTPMAIINAAAQALGLGPYRNDPAVRPRIERIERAVGRLSKLIDTCLADDQLQRHALNHTANLDISELVHQVCENLRDEDLARIDITGPKTRAHTTGNAELLRIAIGNLVQNALKYATGQVHIALQSTDKDLLLDVSNSGPPIPPKEQARIFERYYRGKTASGQPGTGLGLHIALETVHRYGGDVTLLYSDEAKGTCFRVSLPRADSALPASLGMPATGPSEAPAHSGQRLRGT